MTKAEEASAAIILLDVIVSNAEHLTTNGGPSLHKFAARIVRQCRKEMGRQLRRYDKSVAALPERKKI